MYLGVGIGLHGHWSLDSMMIFYDNINDTRTHNETQTFASIPYLPRNQIWENWKTLSISSFELSYEYWKKLFRDLALGRLETERVLIPWIPTLTRDWTGSNMQNIRYCALEIEPSLYINKLQP